MIVSLARFREIRRHPGRCLENDFRRPFRLGLDLDQNGEEAAPWLVTARSFMLAAQGALPSGGIAADGQRAAGHYNGLNNKNERSGDAS
jgi:hypothetical protein